MANNKTTSAMTLCASLRADMAALPGVPRKGWGAFVVCFLFRAGFSAVVLYRFASACHGRLGFFGHFLERGFFRLNIILNGCDIDTRAKIGPGFKLPHPVGVVIGPVTIGSDVMMLQNTTLGMRHFTDDEGDPAHFPVIGNKVIIGAGAVVSGPVKVGDGAQIGANSVVLKDVPAGATAVGVPARIVASEK